MIRNLKACLGAGLLLLVVYGGAAPSAGAASFTAEKYPVTVNGFGLAEPLDAFGLSIKCATTGLTASLSSANKELSLSRGFGGCQVSGLPVTVEPTCALPFSYTAEPAGTMINCAIVYRIYASNAKHAEGQEMCKITVAGSQEGTGLTFTNSAGIVVVTGKVGGLAATQERKSILCPSGTSTNSAEYTWDKTELKASSGGVGVPLDVG